MTEKRFELAYEKGNWWAVRDGEITLWKEEVVGLLNKQEETIKQLEKANKVFGEQIEELEKELNAFKPVMFQDMRKGTVLLYTKEYGDVE